MKKLLTILVLCSSLAVPAAAQFGGRIGSPVPNIKLLIERGTFTPTGPWDFEGPVVFTIPPVIIGGSSVSANIPILGNGSIANPLRLDTSSVTLLGASPAHSALSGIGANDHHAQTTANDDAADLQVGIDTTTIQTNVDANDAELVQVGIDTVTLRTDINSNDVELAAVAVSTANLQSQIDANDSELLQVGIDTATLRTDVDSNDAELLAVGVSTASLQSQVTANDGELVAVGISTASLQTQVLVNDVEIAQIGVDTQTHTDTTDAHFDHADDLTELNTQIGASLADGVHTTDTNAQSECPDGEFLRGEASTTCRTAAEIVGDGGGLTSVNASDVGAGTFPTGTFSFGGSTVTIAGITFQPTKLTSQICTSTCSGHTTSAGCVVRSGDDFSMYSSTANTIGSYRNERTGAGPCL